MAKDKLDKFWKTLELRKLHATKTWNWRRAWLVFELRDFGELFDQWKRQRMTRHVQWVMEPGETFPAGTQYPPSPREQLDHLKKWHAEHKPEYTENAQVAPRWQDDQVLHIRIPKGWTEHQKRSMRDALTTLCNTQVIGEAPKFGEESVG